MLLTLIAVAAFASTVAGGLLALTLRDKLHLILGFSAGAVIAVAFFDLLPEALNLNTNAPRSIVTAASLGFFLYLLFDRLVSLQGRKGTRWRGQIGAGSFSAQAAASSCARSAQLP